VQLSGAVVWGLSFATLLTLVLTPVLLAAPKVMSARVQDLAGRLGIKTRKPAASPEPTAAE
jgi:multidrug efflux pump